MTQQRYSLENFKAMCDSRRKDGLMLFASDRTYYNSREDKILKDDMGCFYDKYRNAYLAPTWEVFYQAQAVIYPEAGEVLLAVIRNHPGNTPEPPPEPPPFESQEGSDLRQEITPRKCAMCQAELTADNACDLPSFCKTCFNVMAPGVR